MGKELNVYELSRAWFDFCFANPELVHPAHTAVYFFAIEHCNRLGWKEKFGFPTGMAMEAIGIKKYQTYIKYFRDIVEWGGFKLVEKSANQYSSNIISIKPVPPKNGKAHGKALDKALIKHGAKQTESTGQSTWQSKHKSDGSIDKQYTSIQDTNIQGGEAPAPEDSTYRKFAHLKITSGEVDKLLAEGYTGEEIDNILDSIQNYKKNTGYTSLYLTARKWLAKDRKTAPKSKLDGILDLSNKLDNDQLFKHKGNGTNGY